jgi:GT2 family glycosyltransferase
LISKVAIVILNWNGRVYLEKFIPFVLASTYPNYDLIVADNASTDDSIEFLKKNFQEVSIIQLKENYGFARGYNEALKQVVADYYVLLNSDVEVQPGWIEPVIRLMEMDKGIGACQPKILTYNDRSTFEYAGGAGGWLDVLGYPFARGRVFDYCEQDEGQYDSVEPIFWASGAAMFVRASLYHKVNGLDEYFFAHQEEIDLCWRLQLAGFMIMACPQSVVYHVGGGTLPKGNERKVFLNFRNNLIMLAKNLPFLEAAWKIPVRLMLDAISAYKSIFAGEATYFIAVLKAHAGFVMWMLTAKKSKPFKRTGVVFLYGLYHKSVIWKHFVNGKNSFAEIISGKR